MGGTLSSHKSQSISAREQVVQTIGLLEKKIQHCEFQIAQLRASAKENMSNKKRALGFLQRAKAIEAQQASFETQRSNLEYQLSVIDSVAMQREVVRVMTVAERQLRPRNELNVDDVQTTLDSIQEHIQVSSEISDALSAPMDPVSLNDAEEEFEAMMQNPTGVLVPATRLEPELPAAPTAELDLGEFASAAQSIVPA